MAVSSCWKDWNSASLSYHTGDCQLNVRIYPDVIIGKRGVSSTRVMGRLGKLSG
jgi:hypothetical protein